MVSSVETGEYRQSVTYDLVLRYASIESRMRRDERSSLFLRPRNATQQPANLVCALLQCRRVLLERLLLTGEHPAGFRLDHDTVVVQCQLARFLAIRQEV